MNAKKLLALLLAVVMVFGLVACGETTTETTAPVETTPVETTAPVANEPSAEQYTVDYATNTVYTGSVTTAMGEVGGGEVGYDVYAGVEGKDYTDPETYTMNDYIGGTTDMNWSPLNWETNDDSYVLDLTTVGFYGFVLNSTGDGWSVTCELAAELPVDVTSEYVGQYGISEGESNKAWKIALNPAACWEDGTPINADTYIYSYMELLDPVMKNRRADSLYAGEFAVVNAKNYFYQGQTVKMDNGSNAYYTLEDLTLGEDGNYLTPGGEPIYVAVNYALDYFSGQTLQYYVEGNGADYFDLTNWEALVACADENGLAPLNDETYGYLLTTITGNAAWGEDESYLPNYMVYEQTYGAMDFSEVGIIKTGEYELVMITEIPTENPNYYVPYNLSGSYLVYEPLWESCKSYFDANGNTVSADSENIANVTTTYGTSLETSVSYGPYKLTYFELDKQITFERNENWYGYSDGKHLGQYQTDVISCQVIAEQATALLAFLNGEIDGVSLTSGDMATYGASEYIRYTPQSYTTKLSFNTDAAALAERGTQIMCLPSFRQAFSLAIDRSTFAASYTSAGSAGYGLLNYMYVYDPFTGAAYRDTDGAKSALCQLYGLTYGEDGEYGDLDEAYDAITGYDMDTAKALMAQAADEAVAAGYWDGSSNITIGLRVYSSDDTYVQMFNYLNDCLKAACVGSALEGKCELEMVVDADYYNTMYSGNADMIFTTWGGAAYSPYSMLYQCYCDAADGSGNQMEYGFDTTKVTVTMEVDGEMFSDNLQNWALWANADTSVQIKGENGTVLETFGSYDADTRANMFSKLEYAYLAYYTTTPMYYRNSASLVSQKGDYAVTQYVDLIGFAGVQFYTYNYTDAQWAEVCAAGLTY